MDSKIWYIPARNDLLEKNVGIYCRVSTNEKEQLYSLAAQISALTRAVANVSQWRLSDIFIDIASAKGEVPRREFERLIRECEVHNISVVLTKSISRFGRDTVETLSALNRLKAAGVRVIFEQENLNTDELDSNLMISVLESLDGEIFIDEGQAKVVRDIFRWYLDGASVLGIIKKLSDAGIPSPTGKECWNKRSIEKMLENEKYTGTVTLLDSSTQEYEYQMKECIPPIITESEFRSVQEEKKKRSNIVTDDDGTHRSSKKYSSKKK
jgi:predicted site-specific integrase-resolvase